MTKYVVGLMFNAEKDHVVMIQKKRPSWQAGLFNGPGGRVEDGELEIDAMIREFNEEAGILTPNFDWKPFLEIIGDGYRVTLFVTSAVGGLSFVKTMTDEEIKIVHVKDVTHFPDKFVPNMSWIIPLAIQSLEKGGPSSTVAYYGE